jgi:hypothetical protein
MKRSWWAMGWGRPGNSPEFALPGGGKRWPAHDLSYAKNSPAFAHKNG